MGFENSFMQSPTPAETPTSPEVEIPQTEAENGPDFEAVTALLKVASELGFAETEEMQSLHKPDGDPKQEMIAYTDMAQAISDSVSHSDEAREKIDNREVEINVATTVAIAAFKLRIGQGFPAFLDLNDLLFNSLPNHLDLAKKVGNRLADIHDELLAKYAQG